MKKEELKGIIRGHGFRATQPRVALLAFLQRASAPMNIQQIAEKLRSSIDQVTIYRMVETFARAGILREVNLRGEHPRYELDDEHDHHHIVCTSCRKVEDFVGCDVEQVEKKALKQSRSFSKVTGHSFDLYGVCNTCAN